MSPPRATLASLTTFPALQNACSSPALTILVVTGLLGVLGGCTDADPATDHEGAEATVFEGARIITGNGDVIESGVFIVEDGVVTYVGESGDPSFPEGGERVQVDLSTPGTTVIPAIVNAHIHLSPEREERISQMRHLAYYGVSGAVSLGHDTGEASFELRDSGVDGAAHAATAGRGITMPEPGRSEAPYWVETAEEAREAVREQAAQGVDIIKIWVDDRGGRYDKMPPEIYGAVIEEAHQHGLQVTAHVFYLEDAKDLLRAGIDVFAHGIRDLDVDDELMELWAERPDVVLVPNLPGPGVARDFGWLAGTVPADQIAEMTAASVDQQAAQERFGIQARNLVRIAGAGLPISFGTDGSSAWTVHEEMEDMVRAGMSPADVIVAATKTSADLMGWDSLGEIAVGKDASFVVLEANPLDDILNTRAISAVYLRGELLDRDVISRELLGSP